LLDRSAATSNATDDPFQRYGLRRIFNCSTIALICRISYAHGANNRGLSMKKSVIVIAAILAVVSVAGCSTVGKAPVGKGPVVAKY
jgi:hypothetical protein